MRYNEQGLFLAMQCCKDGSKLKRVFKTESFQFISSETEHTIARNLRVDRLVHKMEKECLDEAFIHRMTRWTKEKLAATVR